MLSRNSSAEEVTEQLLFEITSARIAETKGDDKKHVVYTLQVRHLSGCDDNSPSTIERRYTDFNNLYTSMKKECPESMSNITFPKKVLIGNFANKLISIRSTGFESLLKHISMEDKLRNSKALLHFLQDIELMRAKKFLTEKQFFFAAPLLESNFKLLNKVYTDRHAAVILALCRLLGCCVSMPGSPNAQKWVDIALHRYEGISDSDLLILYVPLLHVCIKVCGQTGKAKSDLEDRLSDLRKQGIQVNESLSLLDAVIKVEEQIS